MFKNKTILITGGTGTLGKGLLERITDAKEIQVFSRSETEQNKLKYEYPKVKFILSMCD
ncbi:MAG: polysaccharide biosynthesis protein [Nanoarchaeota archaeon]